ncbi:hypothetical protein [Vibrio coralliirubri]|uniref:hypothetical protein n=2 Tax=Vibrionaceae TaxID=641 RepID=UPI00067F6899|nr:hypothetical protein [Vibrio coralliirubri]
MVFPFGLGERLTVRTQLQVLQRKGAQRRSLPCVRVLKWDGLKEVATTSQKDSLSQYLNPKYVAQIEMSLPHQESALLVTRLAPLDNLGYLGQDRTGRCSSKNTNRLNTANSWNIETKFRQIDDLMSI